MPLRDVYSEVLLFQADDNCDIVCAYNAPVDEPAEVLLCSARAHKHAHTLPHVSVSPGDGREMHLFVDVSPA